MQTRCKWESAVDHSLPRTTVVISNDFVSSASIWFCNAVTSLSTVTQEHLEGKLPKGKSVRVPYCRQ
jgi:hypothetical protein